MPEAKSLRLETCLFKRKEDDPLWETGVLVAEGDGGILDLEGKIVPEVWDHHRTSQQVMTVFEEEV